MHFLAISILFFIWAFGFAKALRRMRRAGLMLRIQVAQERLVMEQVNMLRFMADLKKNGPDPDLSSYANKEHLRLAKTQEDFIQNILLPYQKILPSDTKLIGQGFGFIAMFWNSASLRLLDQKEIVQPSWFPLKFKDSIALKTPYL